MTGPDRIPIEETSIDHQLSSAAGSDDTARCANVSMRAFPSYSDAELEQLLLDIRRSDEDSYVTVAHSNAVKD